MSEHIDVHPDRTQFVQLSKEITAHHTDVLFRNDLYDCNIEICSPEVGAPNENNSKPRSLLYSPRTLTTTICDATL